MPWTPTGFLEGDGEAGGDSQVICSLRKSSQLRLAALPLMGISFHPLKLSGGYQKPCSLLCGWVNGVWKESCATSETGDSSKTSSEVSM